MFPFSLLIFISQLFNVVIAVPRYSELLDECLNHSNEILCQLTRTEDDLAKWKFLDSRELSNGCLMGINEYCKLNRNSNDISFYVEGPLEMLRMELVNVCPIDLKIMYPLDESLFVPLSNLNLVSLRSGSRVLSRNGALVVRSLITKKRNRIGELDFDSNHFNSLESLALIFDGMTNFNNKVNRLWLNDISFGSRRNMGNKLSEMISTVLSSPHNQLRHISLTNNSIHNVAALSISLTSPNCQLQSLEIDRNLLDDESMSSLAASFGDPDNHVSMLDLSSSKFSTQGLYNFLNALKQNRWLKRLYLDSNNIGFVPDRGYTAMAFLADVLSSPGNQLMKLSLSNNKIGARGADEILRGLKSPNNVLESLILSRNDLLDYGASQLAKAIKSRKTHLKTLDISHNTIGSQGALDLIKSLKHTNNHLEVINLSENYIGNSAIDAFEKARSNPNFKIGNIRTYDDRITYLYQLKPAIEGSSSLGCFGIHCGASSAAVVD